jgi:excisionase family DNA binding protein
MVRMTPRKPQIDPRAPSQALARDLLEPKESIRAEIGAPTVTKGIYEQRYLSLSQIASYLGIGRQTAYLWAEKGQMPAHKLGRIWRFDREEIDGWVKDGSSGKCYNAVEKTCEGIGRKGGQI